jgi:hypothetical protein
LDSDDFLIFRREKKQYYKWEQAILGLPNVVDAHEVKQMQDRVILAAAFSDLKELIDLRPESGSSYILSSSEPFNEEMEIEYDKFINWLDHFGLEPSDETIQKAEMRQSLKFERSNVSAWSVNTLGCFSYS